MTGFTSYMPIALDQARKAADRGEVPVGAVLVGPGGKVLAADGNRTRQLQDVTAHAEVLVLRAAGRLRLADCDLYVTLEPCAMCAAAIAGARIRRLYYGASDPKSGGVAHGACVFDHPQSHHRPEIHDGIDADRSAALLQAFFKTRR